MSGLLSLLKSRKVWITVLGILVTIFHKHINLTQQEIYVIAGLLAFLAFTIAHEDRGKILRNILKDIDVSLPEENGKYYLKIDLGKNLVVDNKEKEDDKKDSV